MSEIKLAFTSDLHVPMTKDGPLTDMARDAAAFSPDAFVVAGDVAESLLEMTRCLELLKQSLPCPVWVLPGNHDLWARGASSRALWDRRLRETVEAAGCHWLEGTAFVVNGVGVAGTIAWYDYSAADPSIEATAATFAREKQYFNVDAHAIDWAWSDPEFAALVATPFLEVLDRLEADPEVRHTVVATHVPLLECQMCRRPGNRDWNFSNAYFGNLTLGRKVLERRKVTHVISGHTHVGMHGFADRPDGSRVEARVLAGNYGDPRWFGLTLTTRR